MKLNFPMGRATPCSINVPSQFTLFIQFKILPHFLLRAKMFSHCSLLHFCLFIGSVPWETAVTLWCTPACLQNSLVLGFHWLCLLTYICRHKRTLGCRALTNRLQLQRDLLCRSKLQGSFHAYLSKMLFHHINLSMIITGLKLETYIKLLVLYHQLPSSLHLRYGPR